MNTRTKQMFARIGIAASALILSHSAVAAQRTQAKIAEYLFNKIESVNGFVPSSNANSPMISEDGYYYRQYGTERFGVRIMSNDDGFYQSTNGGPWSLIGNYNSNGNEYHGKPIIVIGSLSSKFGRLIKDDALVISNAIATNNPVLIAKHEKTWTDRDKSRIVHAYKTGYPVAILEPTPKDIEAIQILIGEGHDDHKPSAPQSIWGTTNTSQQKSVLAISKSLPVVKGGKSVNYKPGLLEDAMVASAFLDWLRDADRLRGDGLLAKDSPLDRLDKLAQAQVNEDIYRTRGNIYVLQTYYWVAYEYSKKQYWIYARQEDQLAAGNAYNGSDAYWIKGLTSDYYYWNYPASELNTSRVFTHTSSPATTTGSTTTTSGISWNIGGQIGFEGKAATGGVSGGISVESSFSYETPDVTTENRSGQRVNDVNFRFDIAEAQNCASSCSFPRIPRLSYSTFKPVMEWVWRISSDVARDRPNGFIVDQYFQTDLYDWVYYRGPRSYYAENKTTMKQNDRFIIKWPKINP